MSDSDLDLAVWDVPKLVRAVKALVVQRVEDEVLQEEVWEALLIQHRDFGNIVNELIIRNEQLLNDCPDKLPSLANLAQRAYTLGQLRLDAQDEDYRPLFQPCLDRAKNLVPKLYISKRLTKQK